jgi:hypothetical protein
VVLIQANLPIDYGNSLARACFHCQKYSWERNVPLVFKTMVRLLATVQCAVVGVDFGIGKPEDYILTIFPF